MNIASKLQDILTAKADIKDAINAKGGTITDATPLDEYAQAIEDLPSGGGVEELKKVIEGTAAAVSIPFGTTKIRQYVFYYYDTLQEVEIPSSVTRIEDRAFQGTKITALSIPNSVITLGSQFAAFCGALKTLNIGNSVQTIGDQAFYGNSVLTQLIFPDSLRQIGARVTNGCVRLVYLEFGTGIESIGDDSGAKNINCIIVCKATTPPTLGTGFCPNNFAGKIYVPDASVNDYKTATNWSTYAAYIYPLSDYTP